MRACVCSSPPRLAPPPEAEVLEEEGEEEASVPVLPAGRRRDIPRPNLRRSPAMARSPGASAKRSTGREVPDRRSPRRRATGCPLH
ncbi:UNVERIFIED_CONTAM: hypothetical protein Slati_0129400 [Sesamum latifolium]|uniref:Uncharacterized protein n=1 Tax=Sesamum latifolium TaxID=2727402 RepID=A0AAW2Y9B7_9LAMI